MSSGFADFLINAKPKIDRMKFELQFDIEIYKKQMDLLFELAWKKKIDYYRNSQYLGFALLIISFVLFYDRPSLFGCVILISGLGIIIPYFYYYFKTKSAYNAIQAIKIQAIDIYQNPSLSTFEFTENSLIIGHENSFRELYWTDFISYKVYKNNLFMFTKDYEPIIVGENEVGEDHFKNIIDYIIIKFQTTN